MEFDKKTVLAFVLIGVIFIFMQSDFYRERFMPVAEREEFSETAGRPDLESARERPDGNAPREVESPSLEQQSGTVNRRTPIEATGEADSAKEVEIETELYRAVFSTQGASVRSWQLKKYFMVDSSEVELIPSNAFGNLAIKLPTDVDTLDTSLYVFSVDKSSINLAGRHDRDQLVFTLDIDEYKKIRKTFTFYNDSYSIDMKVELINLNDLVQGYKYFLGWNSGLNSTEPDLSLDMRDSQAYAFQGEARDFDVGDTFERSDWDDPTDWVAVRTKYFAVAVIPRSAQAVGVQFSGEEVNVGADDPLKRFGFDLEMPFDGKASRVDEFTVFLGPLDYEIVKAYEVGLENIMSLGWAFFRPFGKFVTWSFIRLYAVVPNYGFAIIIFAILVKIVLYPLTRKSSQSMKEMQAIQPLLQEMNEKYKGDPQKKQQETMKLYKEHGVNPLGGCIPLVMQMPLLIALFNVFQSTIQLRGAAFIWWITDLSRPDTVAFLPFSIPFYGDAVNILPLFMGVTMFIQQKMTMKDPKQKAMVYMMPVFFTFLFNSFPSGLNLYYSLFNLLSIAQDKLIPHKVRNPEEMKKNKRTKMKKKRIKHDYRGRTH